MFHCPKLQVPDSLPHASPELTVLNGDVQGCAHERGFDVGLVMDGESSRLAKRDSLQRGVEPINCVIVLRADIPACHLAPHPHVDTHSLHGLPGLCDPERCSCLL